MELLQRLGSPATVFAFVLVEPACDDVQIRPAGIERIVKVLLVLNAGAYTHILEQFRCETRVWIMRTLVPLLFPLQYYNPRG